MLRTMLIGFVGLLLVAGPAQAQRIVVKKKLAPDVKAGQIVVYETWTCSWGLRDDPPDAYPLGISTFKTEAAARAAADAHMARTSGNGSLAVTHYLIEGEPTVKDLAEEVKKSAEAGKEALDRMKEAKEAVDKARETREKGLTAEERKRGDTIKEYGDALKGAYDRVMTLKRDMTSMTGTIAERQFRNVNNLIDSFNRSRNDFAQTAGSAAGPILANYPAISPIAPGELKGKLAPAAAEGRYTVFVYKQVSGQWVKQDDRTLSTDDADQAEKYVGDVNRVRGWTATSNLPKREPAITNVEGKSGSGILGVINGGTPFRAEFRPGGVVIMSTGEEGVTFEGRWSQTGNSISMRAGASLFQGTLQGKRISGTRSRVNAKRLEDTQDTWHIDISD
jgi:hypothetical protein